MAARCLLTSISWFRSVQASCWALVPRDWCSRAFTMAAVTRSARVRHNWASLAKKGRPLTPLPTINAPRAVSWWTRGWMISGPVCSDPIRENNMRRCGLSSFWLVSTWRVRRTACLIDCWSLMGKATASPRPWRVGLWMATNRIWVLCSSSSRAMAHWSALRAWAMLWVEPSSTSDSSSEWPILREASNNFTSPLTCSNEVSLRPRSSSLLLLREAIVPW